MHGVIPCWQIFLGEESLYEDKPEGAKMGRRWGEELGKEEGRGNCGRVIKTKK